MQHRKIRLYVQFVDLVSPSWSLWDKRCWIKERQSACYNCTRQWQWKNIQSLHKAINWNL